MENVLEMQEQLIFNREINMQLDKIVNRANKTVSRLKPGKNSNSLEESQIRNVLNVANDSPIIEVVTNFIRYQIGRSKTGKQWQYNNFGEQVITDIESDIVFKCAGSVADETIKKLKNKVPNLERDLLFYQAHIKLMKLYLGYINWAFKYSNENNDQKCWNRLVGKESKDVS
ncbi:hypothetical protein GF312_02540 [Candidatus Poribacteria bacterium]|nr:hypothetical protein [Candidatus Poribacteria bacterium]